MKRPITGQVLGQTCGRCVIWPAKINNFISDASTVRTEMSDHQSGYYNRHVHSYIQFTVP